MPVVKLQGHSNSVSEVGKNSTQIVTDQPTSARYTGACDGADELCFLIQEAKSEYIVTSHFRLSHHHIYERLSISKRFGSSEREI
jgi:hypothetical protein